MKSQYLSWLFFIITVSIFAVATALGSMPRSLNNTPCQADSFLHVPADQLTTSPIQFGPLTQKRIPAYPDIVRIADMNNDGIKDAVFSSIYYLFVYTQKHGGGWDKPQTYRSGFIHGLEVGDLNNDHLPDVVVAVDTRAVFPYPADSIRLYFNTPGGRLRYGKTLYAGYGVTQPSIGDVNNDGLADIVTSTSTTDFIRVFYQRPYGDFDSSVVYGNPATSDRSISRIADVNGDGLNDVVINGFYSRGGFSVFFQQPDGSLLCTPNPDTTINFLFSEVNVGDFNHDGRTDVLATRCGNAPDASFYVYLQDSTGNIFTQPHIMPTYDIPTATDTGDFDSDGRLDFVTIHRGWNRLSIYRQNAAGTFDDPLHMETHYLNSDPGATDVADINGDGKLDIVSSEVFSGLMIWLNRTTELVSAADDRLYDDHSSKGPTPFVPACQPQSLTKGMLVELKDIYGRTIPSFLKPGENPFGRVEHYDDNEKKPTQTLSDTLRFADPVIRPDYPDVNCVRIADFNGDGRNDCIGGISSWFNVDQSILFLYQNESGQLNEPVKYGWADVYSIDVADLNGDHLNDLVLEDAGHLRVIYQGSGGTLIDTLRILDSGIVSVRIGDLNNDGRPDIATSYVFHPYIKVYYQSPEGRIDVGHKIVTTKVVDGRGDPVVETGDLNHDGLTDLVFGGGPLYNNAISVYLQNSAGELMFNKDIGVPTFIEDVAVGDVTGDGRDDIVVPLHDNNPDAYILVFPQDSTGQLPDVPLFYEAPDLPDALDLGDFDLDGRLDLVSVSAGWPVMGIYRQNRAGEFDTVVTFATPSVDEYNHRGSAVGDINSDGKPDVALGAESCGLVTMLNQTKITTGVDGESAQPLRFALQSNYPNPFNPTTTISYVLPARSHVSIRVYNILGQEVSTLVNEHQYPGQHTILFRGDGLSSGVYFYQIVAGTYSQTRKMLLTR